MCVVFITSLYSFLLLSSHNVFSLYTQTDTFSEILTVIWMSGKHFSEEKKHRGAGEMSQRLSALPVLPKVLSSISSNYMLANNHL